MKRTIGIISALFLLSALCAFARDPEQEKMKSEILSASEKITSIDCDFTQTKSSSLLSGEAVSHGKMKYRKPDYLEWRYTGPFKMAFILDAQSVSLEKDGKTEDMSRNRALREIPRLIIGNIEGSFFADKTFDIVLEREKDEIVARLRPLNREMKKMWTEFVLHYTADTYAVRSLELYETNGDVTVIRFKNCIYGFQGQSVQD